MTTGQYGIQPTLQQHEPIPAGTSIGHVHLKVSNIEKALKFYRDVLGFEVMLTDGRTVAFLSAGGYHHHIGLNTWESANGKPPPPGSTGLYHTAILYPTRKDLARAVQRLMEHNYPIDGASDHGVSEAIYLHDPDHNGVELYADRPREAWPKTAEGEFTMFTQRLDFDSLLGELT
jgi:catechol 2,3-dioxygenase